MYAALTELEQWLTAASNWLTGAALVISLPLAAVYIGCMAEARREDSAAQTDRKKGWDNMKQSEKLEELLKLMQANPELPVVPCVDGDVVGGDEYYCWLGSWGESAIQEFIVGKERTYYREEDICEMNDVLYERYDPELVDNMTDEETRAAYNALPWKKAIFVDVHQYEEEPDAEV